MGRGSDVTGIGVFFCPQRGVADGPPQLLLTKREGQALILTAEGLSNKEFAHCLRAASPGC